MPPVPLITPVPNDNKAEVEEYPQADPTPTTLVTPLPPQQRVEQEGFQPYDGTSSEVLLKGEGDSTEKFFEKTHSGFSTTRHGVDRKIEREVKSMDELNALKNPLKVGKVKHDAKGLPSQRYVGRGAEVVINPETGKIISVNPTSTEKLERLLKKLNEKN